MRDQKTAALALAFVLMLGACRTLAPVAPPATAGAPATPQAPATSISTSTSTSTAASTPTPTSTPATEAGCGPAGRCERGELAQAQRLARRARQSAGGKRAQRDWLDCASRAHLVLAVVELAEAPAASALAGQCVEGFLTAAGAQRTWPAGPVALGDARLVVEHRGLSRHFTGELRLVPAARVPMAIFDGQRRSRPGHGVAVAALSPRCEDRPECALQPLEGIFRWATAWIEPGATPAEPPRLVIADPLVTGALSAGGRAWPLALDTSAHYAQGAGSSALPRLGWFGLLGGREVGRRAGVYVLGDYDPRKRPVVMLHGLGSNPLIWAKLTNEVWGDPLLRERFQVWHLVYQTNAPLLVTRMRVQAYLDQAWRLLDPEGDDPARQGMVLVGHSMGGVVSRLLSADSGDVLWDSAFTVPPAQLPGSAADVDGIRGTFLFRPYPGVVRAVFIAAPHRGSPTADGWIGQFSRWLVGRRVPEVQALRRVASDHPDAVQPTVRESYRQAALNSIATLQSDQPVRRAGEHLLPVPGIAYHSIAGALPGREPPTDGAVPLASTELPAPESSLVIATGHDVYRHDDAVAEVVRILHVALARDAAGLASAAPPDPAPAMPPRPDAVQEGDQPSASR